MTAPSHVVDWVGSDETDGDGRSVEFRTIQHGQSEWLAQLHAQLCQLPVRLQFADGRDSYKFEVPVVLLANRSRWVYSLVLSGLATFLTSLFSSGRLSLPSSQQLLLGAGILLVLLAVFFSWDFYKRAVAATGLPFSDEMPPAESR